MKTVKTTIKNAPGADKIITTSKVSRETEHDEPAEFDGGQAEVIQNMVETDEVKKKERKKGSSTIYLLKAFKHHINSLATQKVCTLEEIQSLREIHKKATQRWIGLELDGEQ